MRALLAGRMPYDLLVFASPCNRQSPQGPLVPLPAADSCTDVARGGHATEPRALNRISDAGTITGRLMQPPTAAARASGRWKPEARVARMVRR